VIHAVKKINELIDKDEEIRKNVLEIRKKIL
jgi:chromosomal replication initiation ATPase DnaA